MSSSSSRRVPSAAPVDRFVLERLLGSGGMGSVWVARHPRLDIDVAVKLLEPGLARDPAHLARFRQEATAAAQIRSRHVVRVLDHGVDERERPFICMELLEGIDLTERLAKGGPLGFEEVSRIVAHVCRGLRRAHEAGIVHRDIKPENLFLCPDEEELEPFVVKILDFGVAKDLTRQLDMTQRGHLVGTPHYMSPEQAKGVEEIDYRADLYALAAVAYTCLCGRAPFGDLAPTQVLVALGTREPPRITSLRAGLPSGIDEWFRIALDREPARRFESARELAATFAALDPALQLSTSSTNPSARIPTSISGERRRIAATDEPVSAEAETEVFGAEARVAATKPNIPKRAALSPRRDAPEHGEPEEEAQAVRLSPHDLESLKIALRESRPPREAPHPAPPAVLVASLRWLSMIVVIVIVIALALAKWR